MKCFSGIICLQLPLFLLFAVWIKAENDKILPTELSDLHPKQELEIRPLKYSKQLATKKSKGSIMFKDRSIEEDDGMEITTETENPTTQEDIQNELGTTTTASTPLGPEALIEAPSEKEFDEFIEKSIKNCDKFLLSSSKEELDGDVDKRKLEFSNNMLQRCLLLHAVHARTPKLSSKHDLKKEKSKVDMYLPDDYNQLEVPRLNSTLLETEEQKKKNKTHHELKPVDAGIYLIVRGIRGIDEVNEEVTIDVDVCVYWIDGQILKNSQEMMKSINLPKYVFMNPVFMKKIWTPDLYFEEANSIESPSFMGKAETVVLVPSAGVVQYKTRLIVKLNCEMNFFYYPADTQKCTFSFRSFSYTTNDVVVSWWNISGNDGVYLLETSDPNYDYQAASLSSQDLPLKLGATGTPHIKYSTLEFKIKSRRKLSYHVVQTYLPSSFFIILTWLCFMIPSEMFEIRIGISMTTLLTLTAMFASVRESTPTVSYVTAIDIWMVGCIFFLFAALTTFTASHRVSEGLKKLRAVESETMEENSVQGQKRKKRIFWDERNGILYEIAECFIQKYLSWLLSLGFILFIITYWSWLLTQSEYYNWKVNKSLNYIE